VDRLFEPFVRIKNDKTVGILGSGLGLAIVRKVASMYDGEVKVASEAGAGSTFTVILRETLPEADAQK
jgi:two-component system phosphate regulon sensor histidine kinase PhoR